MNGVQGCLGRRSSPGTRRSPQDLCPRARPSPPCFHPPTGNTPGRAQLLAAPLPQHNPLSCQAGWLSRFRGPGCSPDLCPPPRAPLAPCFHPPATHQAGRPAARARPPLAAGLLQVQPERGHGSHGGGRLCRPVHRPRRAEPPGLVRPGAAGHAGPIAGGPAATTRGCVKTGGEGRARGGRDLGNSRVPRTSTANPLDSSTPRPLFSSSGNTPGRALAAGPSGCHNTQPPCLELSSLRVGCRGLRSG